MDFFTICLFGVPLALVVVLGILTAKLVYRFPTISVRPDALQTISLTMNGPPFTTITGYTLASASGSFGSDLVGYTKKQATLLRTPGGQYVVILREKWEHRAAEETVDSYPNAAAFCAHASDWIKKCLWTRGAKNDPALAENLWITERTD